jgi:hypothetical protein
LLPHRAYVNPLKMPLDCFKILQMPRQPWLDEADVRNRFHQLAADTHPDVAAGESGDFANLNHAWQTLRSPASRLRHFLELEHPGALSSAQFTVPKSPELFMQISELQQTARSTVAKLSEAKSPLTRALLEPQRLAVLRTLEQLEAGVADQIRAVHQVIQSPRASPEALASALNELTFLEKWNAQLRETRFALG